MNTDTWQFKKFETLDEKRYFLDHKNRFIEFKKIINGLDNVRSICDVGLGVGSFYKIFEKGIPYIVSGVDIVPEYVSLARERGIDAKACDMNKESLPFGDSVFDLVICDSFLEHSLNPLFLVSECLRVVRPNGYVLFTTPNAMSFTMRWSYLVGRNPFWPLIHNLISGVGYLRRCSIFYGKKELEKLFPEKQMKFFYVYENFYRDRKSSIVVKVLNQITKIIPSGREIIGVIVTK